MNYRLTEQDIRLMLGSTYERLECWPDDGLHGRRVVYTNTKQITADNVVEVVGKALIRPDTAEGERRQLMLDKLYKYYSAGDKTRGPSFYGAPWRNYG